MEIIKIKEPPLADVIDKYTRAFDYVKQKIANRNEQIDVIKLAILCNSHVLLEGQPGVGKSLMARYIFQLFDSSFRVFSKQFMANTQPDEVFGPMNIRKLRQDSTIQFNTRNMIPRAHFAFLDELYHASDSLLPALMGILNERVFYNGPLEMHCPLITAIATTNFVSDKPELQAFHDRWLARLLIQPADSKGARRRILDLFWMNEVFDFPDQITMHELRRLQRAVQKVQLTDLMMEMYEELSNTYQRAITGGTYISDRRYCETTKLIKASLLLNSDGEHYADGGNVDTEALVVSKYALLQNNESEHVGAMNSAIETVVGSYDRSIKEEPEIAELEQHINGLFKQFDDNTPTVKKRKMLETVTSVIEEMNALQPNEQFTLPRNIERFTKVKERAAELQRNLQSSLGLV